MKSSLLLVTIVFAIEANAQDYLISFAGSGTSTTVDSVIIENLTQQTILKMKGSDVLHLRGLTGIETITGNNDREIFLYPNPMKDYALMQFVLPESGEALITLNDFSGREIIHARDLLSAGKHAYRIQGIERGIYFIRIITYKYSYSCRLISYGSQNANVKIVHENTFALQEKDNGLKGGNEEKEMQYNPGDMLQIMGISGKYSTVTTDVPAATKTITFNFIACTDGDNNNYPVVQLGTTKGATDNADPSNAKGVEIWMAENLKTTRFNNGLIIPLVTNNTEWSGLTTPGYGWFANNETKYKELYGALYNWYAAAATNLCPVGWHVPSNEEWTALTDFLGGSNIAGGKLKETGTVNWKSPNTGATNETGFRALPGGFRESDGNSGQEKYNGNWWTSSSASDRYAWYWFMYYNLNNVTSGGRVKQCGLSVRCILN